MLTRLIIRNFKRFNEIDIELGERVVLIGPNNSGKTSALQALALWEAGLKKWIAKTGRKVAPKKRPGVTINRRDLIAIPVPTANLLWRDLHVRSVAQKKTQNIRIDIVVHGVSGGQDWQCGLEFDYANEESFYCRPLRLSEEQGPERMEVPPQAAGVRVACLLPMSGLSAREDKLEAGAVNVRLGEGRTAEVLRNLCYGVLNSGDEKGGERWQRLTRDIERLFGATLEEPRHMAGRGEITLSYKQRGIELDISSAGRGLQQTLLLLAYMAANPGTVLLFDEPDAHLEVLRQRQTYQLLTERCHEAGGQIVAASHSEVILNEAADRDIVVAFVGKPHRIDDRAQRQQVVKALKEIGFDQYYLAEQTGWVLYLEGSTDLSILQAFSAILKHDAKDHLERAFVHDVGNQPKRAKDHFHALREAKGDFTGFAIYDREPLTDPKDAYFEHHVWKKREIENYLCQRDVLVAWARDFANGQMNATEQPGDTVFTPEYVQVMNTAIDELTSALATARKPSPFSADIKATDDFLDPLFANFFDKLKLPNLLRKSDYHELARFVTGAQLDPEITQVLDKIVEVAKSARPVGGGELTS